MRNFPDWILAFQQYASFGEAPPEVYEWVGVSTVAGALRRRVWINMGYFEWTPNFYIVLTAPPGIISKSTSAAIGMNLLRAVPGVRFGPDIVTWQALSLALSEATEAFPDGDGVLHPMSAITIESSEFGNLMNPNDREMVDFYVTLWDGKRGELKKVTKGSGSETIVNPWVNLIACTTPAWIAGNFPEYMIGGGFTSRCIFVYAEHKSKFVAYPGLVMPQNIGDMKLKLIQDLEAISQLIGEYKLTPDAVLWGEEWYKNHYENVPMALNNDRFGGYIARKQTHMHKLAMVLAASRSDTLLVDVPHLEKACDMLSRIEPMMVRVFSRMGRDEMAQKGDEILNIVRATGGISFHDLYIQCFRSIPDADEFNKLLQSLLYMDLITKASINGKETIFPAPALRLNQ